MSFLLQRLKARARGEGGFTLVELLVVVAIIAVLAAVLVPRLTGYGNNARISRTMGDLATMRSIIEAYSANEGKGSYPVPSNDGANPASVAAVLQGRGVKWTGGIDGIRDPWGTPYSYAASTDEYIIVSAGPNKTPGGGDDIYTTESQSPVQGDPPARSLDGPVSSAT